MIQFYVFLHLSHSISPIPSIWKENGRRRKQNLFKAQRRLIKAED